MGSYQLVGQVLLLDPVVRVVVGIQVSLLPLHGVAVRVDVLQMPGEIPGFALANVCQRCVQGDVPGIGLGTGGHEYGSISQRDPGFRHSQLQSHIHAGVDDGDNLRVGKAHILGGNDHEPPAGGGHLPRFQQPGQIVAGRIRVGAPDGFLQGGQQIIVVVPIPVSPQGAFLGDGFRVLQSQGQNTVFWLPGGEQHLHRVHGLAQVTAAGHGDVFQSPILGVRFQRCAALHIGNRPLYRLQRRLSRNLLELKHGGAAQNGVEHVEIGIFRGGGNQGDLAVFNVLKQGLLLLFIEGLNFIQVQQHPVGCQKGVQLGHNFLNVRRGGSGGVELVQGAVGLLCDDVGHGSFSRAAGAVEDHVGNIPGINEPPQHGVRPQDMLLTVDLVQCGGPQKIGQRLIHRQPSF